MTKDFYVEVKASGGITPSGIGYRRVIPTMNVSSRTGDVGWHIQNGTFDYSSDTNTPEYIQSLDYATYGYANDSGFYHLTNNNAFGNKYRFTNSIGGAASDGGMLWTAADFTGALDGYVIDHLTGIGYDILLTYNNNWNNCIDQIAASTYGGYSDWFPISFQHLFNLSNDSYLLTSTTSGQANFMAYAGSSYQYIWAAGETAANANANSFRFQTTTGVISNVGKTSASYRMVAARNHY